MAGIYLHIPFCRKACHYCDFHFSTSLALKEKMLWAMKKELQLRAEYIPNESIHTIYFGGGTPSVLSRDELMPLFDAMNSLFSIDANAEITLEANPDDLNASTLAELKDTPVNRMSIGIQSFRDEDLILMNRSHSSRQAESAVKRSQDAGFHNLTVDLIYGIPGLDMTSWKHNLDLIFELNVPHFSAYCLTIEEKTAFAQFVRKGIIRPVPDQVSSEQFLLMSEWAVEQGFEHYEVSNFAKPGMRSRHNSAYWSGEAYIGIGPSAHSFDGRSRQWNVSNNHGYVRSLESNDFAPVVEFLTPLEQLNEYIMTGMRTSEGIDMGTIQERFHFDFYGTYKSEIERLVENGKAICGDGILALTAKGFLFADRVASDFFVLGGNETGELNERYN